jgi:hypothetical protein
VKMFRNLGEQIMPPAVDLNRLTANLARVAQLDQQLNVTLAQLANDLPGDANAVAAAGIAFRAQINKSASMIELGVAAVDALRRAGWLLTAPVARAAADLAAQESAKAGRLHWERNHEREDAAEAAARARGDIPEDWVS